MATSKAAHACGLSLQAALHSISQTTTTFCGEKEVDMLSTLKHTGILIRCTILAAASLCGCDDLMVNSPIEVNKFERHQMASPAATQPMVPLKPAPPPGSGSLPLEGTLRVPGGPFITFASINGEVTYSLMCMPYRRAFRMSIDLSIDATLIPEGAGTTIWRAEGKSHDQLFLLQGGSVILEKSCTVVGPDKQMALHMQFLLTPDRIRLKGMRLKITHTGPGSPI